MKELIKIKTDYVPEWCDYITPGKVYPARHWGFGAYAFNGDDGVPQETLLDESAHLDWASWEVVEEE